MTEVKSCSQRILRVLGTTFPVWVPFLGISKLFPTFYTFCQGITFSIWNKARIIRTKFGPNENVKCKNIDNTAKSRIIPSAKMQKTFFFVWPQIRFLESFEIKSNFKVRQRLFLVENYGFFLELWPWNSIWRSKLKKIGFEIKPEKNVFCILTSYNTAFDRNVRKTFFWWNVISFV